MCDLFKKGLSGLAEFAVLLLNTGLSVIPAGPEMKCPVIRFKEFLSRRMTEKELRSAWNNADRFCIACGAVSGNFEAIDFDDPGDTFERWKHEVQASHPDLFERLYVEKSPHGWHVCYRSEGPVDGHLVLARQPDGSVLIETRGQGFLVVCAPSAGYTALQGDLADPPVVSVHERQFMFGAARALTEAPVAELPTRCSSGGEVTRGRQAHPLIDDCNSRGWPMALAESEANGWVQLSTPEGAQQEWKRPNKQEEGHSATFDGKTFFVHSTNASPFARGPYDAADVLTILRLGRPTFEAFRDPEDPEHNGAVRAVFQLLRELGFGKQDPRAAHRGIYIGKTRERGEILSEITDRILPSNRFFSRNGQLFVVSVNERGERRGQVVTDTNRFAALVGTACEFFTVKGKHDEWQVFFEDYPYQLMSAWLLRETEIDRLPRIKAWSRGPVITDDGRLLQPGYDAASGIYSAGPNITRVQGTKYLNQLLSGFCFREESDRTNFLAVLTTGLLLPQFLGTKPCLLISGNGPGVGKTLLAQALATLVEGNPAPTLSFSLREEEMEKTLGATCAEGASVIVIDNARLPHGRKIESQSLERLITDPYPTFRRLGSSTRFGGENSFLVCLTANSSQVSSDLLSRCVVVNLFFEGDPSKRTFELLEPLDFARRHRPLILGEVADLALRWHEEGRPAAEVECRFSNWARTIGGILSNASITGFLENRRDVEEEFDERIGHYLYFLEFAVKSHRFRSEDGFRANDVVEALPDHPFGFVPSSGGPRAVTSSVGRFLARFVNIEYSVSDGRRFRLIRITTGKNAPYRLVEVVSQAEKTPPSDPAPPVPKTTARKRSAVRGNAPQMPKAKVRSPDLSPKETERATASRPRARAQQPRAEDANKTRPQRRRRGDR